MEVEKWEVGAAFIPASLGYLLGTGVFGGLAGHTLARWKTAQTGLKIIGISLAMVSCEGAREGQEVRTGQVADSLHLAVMLCRGHNLLE